MSSVVSGVCQNPLDWTGLLDMSIQSSVFDPVVSEEIMRFLRNMLTRASVSHVEDVPAGDLECIEPECFDQS